MRRILFALAFLSPLWALPAFAVDCQYRATSPTLPDQQFIILQCDSAGKLLTTQTPSSATSAGITPVVSAAAEASKVFKASAGNLYAYQVTTGAAAGFVMIFDATSAPADGAVTPVKCVAVAANSTVGVSMEPPEAFSTGITAVFSTTGCFTKTASATAMFSGDVK
jgi:hypothetical protein